LAALGRAEKNILSPISPDFPDFPGLRKIQGYERLRCEIEALKIEAQALPDERIGTIQAGEC